MIFHLHAPWLPGGFVGVDVFFAISGFVVCASVASLPAGSLGVFGASFYARRVVRIAPALVACLLLTGIISTLFVPQAWLSQVNHKTGFTAFFGFSNIVLALLTGDYFSPRAEFNPFTHTWSLAVEEQFYLLFPFLIYAGLRGKTASRQLWTNGSIALLTVASLAVCMWWGASRPVLAFYLLPARFWELGIGVLAWLSMPFWRNLWGNAGISVQNIAATLSLAGIFSALVLADPAQFPFPWALLPVICTGILLTILASGDRSAPGRLLASTPFTWVGLRSYSLYLWHWPVLVLMHWTTGLETPTEFVIAATLSTVLAMASYQWIELPIRHSGWIRTLPRFRVVIGGLMLVTLLALATGAMFKFKPHISLSTTANGAMWFPHDETALIQGTNCKVRWAQVPFDSGDWTKFSPQECSIQPSKFKVFVIGDSHAGAYSAMFRHFSGNTGIAVEMLNMHGCPFFALFKPNAQQAPDCANFTAKAMKKILDDAKPGDVVFMPALRLRRITDQWTIPTGTLEDAMKLQPEDRTAAVDEAVTWLNALSRVGVSVMLEAPKPLSPSPAFRCSDWFNGMNPVCKLGPSVPRGSMESYRRQALSAINEVANAVPRATVWDPLPLLCDQERCQSVRGGKPLIFDGDHLSGHANRMLTGSFTAHVVNLMSKGETSN
jgi:peptidoglycan/LPS O-acetylase OafA/YrhL